MALEAAKKGEWRQAVEAYVLVSAVMGLTDDAVHDLPEGETPPLEVALETLRAACDKIEEEPDRMGEHFPNLTVLARGVAPDPKNCSESARQTLMLLTALATGLSGPEAAVGVQRILLQVLQTSGDVCSDCGVVVCADDPPDEALVALCGHSVHTRCLLAEPVGSVGCASCEGPREWTSGVVLYIVQKAVAAWVDERAEVLRAEVTEESIGEVVAFCVHVVEGIAGRAEGIAPSGVWETIIALDSQREAANPIAPEMDLAMRHALDAIEAEQDAEQDAEMGDGQEDGAYGEGEEGLEEGEEQGEEQGAAEAEDVEVVYEEEEGAENGAEP